MVKIYVFTKVIGKLWVPWKFSRVPEYAHARLYFAEIFNGLLFRSILGMCVQNLKFVALPIPEIIGGTQNIWAIHGYAHVPFSPKFLMGFCSDGPGERIPPNLKFEALPVPEIIGGMKKIGRPCIYTQNYRLQHATFPFPHLTSSLPKNSPYSHGIRWMAFGLYIRRGKCWADRQTDRSRFVIAWMRYCSSQLCFADYNMPISRILRGADICNKIAKIAKEKIRFTEPTTLSFLPSVPFQSVAHFHSLFPVPSPNS